MAAENNKPEAEKPDSEKTTKIEHVITVLLGITTVLGALAAYFASLWGGEMQSSYSKSVTQTNHANTIYLEALNDLSAFEMNDLRDDIIYSQWKENQEKGDAADAQYFFSKLSEGFQKDLLEDPTDVSAYENQQKSMLDTIQARFREAESGHDEAEALMQKGNNANKYGDDFTLCTVLFTVVLFFLGLASLKTKASIQKTYVVIGCVIFLLSFIRLLTIPFPL